MLKILLQVHCHLLMKKGTITWYAFRIDASTFGIFDTFSDEEGREAHLGGKIAKALMENAPELLATATIY